MSVEMLGKCIYCGQMQHFTAEEDMPEEERDRKATEMCDCEKARKAQEQVQVQDKAKTNITRLFHENNPVIEGILLDAVKYVHGGPIDKIAITCGTTKAQMKIMAKGNIKVECEKKTKTSLDG